MLSRPLRVALLCSRRAPGLELLLGNGAGGERRRSAVLLDGPARGWELAAVLTSDPGCREIPALEEAGVPWILHDITAFYRSRGRPVTDLGARRDYDRRTGELLAPFRPDLLVLCGWLHILTGPILAAWPARIVNLHDSDLTLSGPDGKPRYRGLRSTRDAIFAGEAETRSTVHLVTEEVDVGPPVLLSWPFRVHALVAEARTWGAADILKAYAFAQREWMMRAAWGPLLARTLDLFAHDGVRVLGGRAAVDGTLGPLELPAPHEARRGAARGNTVGDAPVPAAFQAAGRGC